MLDKLNIKKEYLLILATLLLLFISYEFAFKNTITAWQANKELKAKLSQAGDLSFQPAYLERKSNNLDRVISQYKADTTSLRSNLINTISLIADRENVMLSEVPVQDAAYNSDKAIIEKLEFGGDYFSLARLSNALQHKNGIGVIRSEDLKIINIRTDNSKDRKLTLEMYLEIVK
jgi:hypothetical protein